MIKEAYYQGVVCAFRKHAGLFETILVPRIVPAAVGSLIGSSLGYPMGASFAPKPEGSFFGLLPPTQGQADYALQKARGQGMVLGALVGGGLGALSPEILKLLKYREGTVGDKLKTIF